MDAENIYPQLIIKANSSDIHSLNEIHTAPRSHVVPATVKENQYDSKVSQYFEPTIKKSENFENCM